MRFVMLGSGNVAHSLSKILLNKGHKCLQVYSRNFENAIRLADACACFGINDVRAIDKNADMYIFAVKDDIIQALSYACENIIPEDKICFHLSGSKALNEFTSYYTNNAIFYPLQTFVQAQVVDWLEIPILIEARQNSTQDELLNIAKSISQHVYLANSHQRAYIHLAAVFANNFTNMNLYIAKDIMSKSDLPFDILHALMKQSIQNAFTLNPDLAQTGPAKRNDVDTITKHLQMLDNEFPQWKEDYASMTKSILKIFHA